MEDVKDIEQLKLAFESSKNDQEKLDAVILIAKLLGKKNDWFEEWIERGIKLKNVSIGSKIEIYQLKNQFLFTNGKMNENIAFIDKYSKLLEENPRFKIHWIENQKYKMVRYSSLGKKEASVQIGENIFNTLKDDKDDEIQKKLCEIYWMTGGNASNLGDYDKCMNYFEKALEISKKYDLINEQIPLYGALGDIYKGNKEFKKAKKYLELGITLSKKTKLNNIHVILYIKLSELYFIESNIEKTKYYLDKANQLAIELNHPRSLINVMIRKADFFIKINDLKSFYGLEKSIKDNEYFNSDLQLQSQFFNIVSEASFTIGNFETALKYSNLNENLELKLNGLINLMNAYRLKIKILKALKKFELANEYYEKFIKLKEKSLSEANKKSLNEFEVKFQSERKEREIQVLKLESVSFQLQFLRAQMNPHFIFNTIGSISADLNEENIEKSKSLLNNFSSLMRATLDFADTEKITLEEEIEFLENYLNLEKYRLEDMLEYEIFYSEDISKDFIEIPSMIIQPYIENAIKHGIKPLEKVGRIRIEFKEIEDDLICTITDNGIGREASARNNKKVNNHIGKSTTINAKRLSLLKTKDLNSINVKYTDLKNTKLNVTGTKVELTIKL